MFDIRLEGKTPIYEQLFSGISQHIMTGQLKADERLPAVREVAKHLGINPNTVQKTYALLEQSGLIYSIPAKGSYVSADRSGMTALHDDALRKLEAAMETARSSGVTRLEVLEAASRVWCNTEDQSTQ